MPKRDQLLEQFYAILKTEVKLKEQALKGKALLCAGHLAQACGPDHFPVQALEEFTKFGLECLQQTESKYELKETAMNYFGEICKIMKCKMEPILATILEPMFATCDSEVGLITKEQEKKSGIEFELESDEE
jgi:hypothetical protein